MKGGSNMELNKILDLAIMKAETASKPELKSGYKVVGRKNLYENYLDNNCWKKLYDDMDKNHHTAFVRYGNGGGKELKEHTSGAHTYPPKMASFGSSSRMIYELAKDIDGFFFEEKLPTTVGGTANLDGFKKKTDKCIFVEAKCREPYSKKSGEVERKYQKLYEFIRDSSKTTVTCTISDLVDPKKNMTKMKVKFKSGSTEIVCFDMKQMICHLLGIATAFLNGKYDVKNIEFLYLLFNPNLIEINSKEIAAIYKRTCDECQSIDFKSLFEVIVEYLVSIKKWKKELLVFNIIDKFSFELVDQSVFAEKIK